MKTLTTLMSGGGGVEVGAMAAGITPILGVEYSEEIADHYTQTIGDHVLNLPVQLVDWSKQERPDFAHASPVCTRFSIANTGAEESPVDLEAAEGVCRFLRVLMPRVFTLENVSAYQHSCSFANICKTLQECGYTWEQGILNSADFGVPQTRKRFIVRAVLGGRVPPLRRTHTGNPLHAGILLPKWRGWYEAIEDLIPTLPPSKFADLQIRRLPPELRTLLMIPNGEGSSHRLQEPPAACITANHGMDKHRAFLLNGDNGSRDMTTCSEGEPSFTLASLNKCTHRAFIVEGSAAGEQNKFNMPVRTDAELVFTMRGQQNNPRAFLIDGDAAGERCPTLRDAEDPATTIKTSSGGRVYRAFLVDSQQSNGWGDERKAILREKQEPLVLVPASIGENSWRAWLEQGRVVSMTTRALCRFQSFPDSYPLPANKRLACLIIGNAACPLMMQRIFESLMDV